MDNLIIEGNSSTPSIDFDINNGMLKIVGRSIPENPIKFYQPIEDWVKEFINTNPPKLTLQIHLDYLNTHSTECVLIIIKKISDHPKLIKTDVKVIWNFDEYDDDMADLGRDLSSLFDIPFECIEVIQED